MDVISSVAFDLTAATAGVRPAQGAADAAASLAPPTSFDIAHFNAAYGAAAAHAPQGPAEVPKIGSSETDSFRSVMVMLKGLNGGAESLGAIGTHLTGDTAPGDVLQMTLLAHEFLFHCELTSNIANRTSDGVQQLFQEQS